MKIGSCNWASRILFLKEPILMGDPGPHDRRTHLHPHAWTGASSQRTRSMRRDGPGSPMKIGSYNTFNTS